MADPFIKKQPTELEKDTVNKIIENTLNKRKRPVKFTWKGAADLLATMSNTPLRNYQIKTLMDDKLPRVTDLAEGRDKPKEKDYIDFFQDVEKGLFGGVQDLGYAIGDLLTSGIDAAADTNLTEELTKVYEENKIKDPETLTGEITKLLTQYGVPGGAVFKVLNRVKALSKARWCSSDPLCIEDKNGKGFMGVNLAACHSCSLLPETSCCNMNKFLDRGLVVGTIENPYQGLFN